MREDEDNEQPIVEEEEFALPVPEKKTSKKSSVKKPAAKTKRVVGKSATKAKAPKAPKPAKAAKEAKPKAAKEAKPKAAKVKKAITRSRSPFELTGERESVKIDKVFIKHLQRIANVGDLASIHVALDRVVSTGLTRLAALAKYASKP